MRSMIQQCVAIQGLWIAQLAQALPFARHNRYRFPAVFNVSEEETAFQDEILGVVSPDYTRPFTAALSIDQSGSGGAWCHANERDPA